MPLLGFEALFHVNRKKFCFVQKGSALFFYDIALRQLQTAPDLIEGLGMGFKQSGWLFIDP